MTITHPVRRMAGLTLVELMITIAIVAILAMTAGPSFSSFSARSKLRGVAEEAYADLQFARSESAQKNRAVRVEFSATGYQVWLMSVTDPAVKDSSLKIVDWNGSGNSASSGASMVVTYNPVRANALVSGGPLVVANSRIDGTIRVTVGTTGRGQLCSPGGSVSGIPSCPPPV